MCMPQCLSGLCRPCGRVEVAPFVEYARVLKGARVRACLGYAASLLEHRLELVPPQPLAAELLRCGCAHAAAAAAARRARLAADRRARHRPLRLAAGDDRGLELADLGLGEAEVLARLCGMRECAAGETVADGGGLGRSVLMVPSLLCTGVRGGRRVTRRMQ